MSIDVRITQLRGGPVLKLIDFWTTQLWAERNDEEKEGEEGERKKEKKKKKKRKKKKRNKKIKRRKYLGMWEKRLRHPQRRNPLQDLLKG